MGLAQELRLGNLNAKRDWGHAREYVKAMWLMLQQDESGDYVISTGKSHNVKDFLTVAFGYVGLDYRDYVVVDKQFIRPADVETLLGDSSKAQSELGWKYTLSFEDLVQEMVTEDLKLIESGRTVLSKSHP